MANAKCRSCDHAADAGAYCSSCAADIMAKALNPFFGGRQLCIVSAVCIKSPCLDLTTSPRQRQ